MQDALFTAPSSDVPQATDFETFWEQYPKRKGLKKGKAAARDKWKRMTGADRQAAMTAVSHFAALVEATGEWPKDAVRWLRGREFDDLQEAPDLSAVRREGVPRNLYVSEFAGPARVESF